MAGHQLGEHGVGLQEVCEWHPRPRQGDGGMGCLRGAGLHREERGDLAEGRGGAAEPGHQRPPLGAAHAGHAGVQGRSRLHC